MDKIDATFPKSLKNLRLCKGLGQKQMALELNLTVKTISHWETGYSEPSVSQLIMLADFFDVSIDELVGHIL